MTEFHDETGLGVPLPGGWIAWREVTQPQREVRTTVVRPTGRGLPRWAYCKYCYRSVYPVIMQEAPIELAEAEDGDLEWVLGRAHEMVICSVCGAGLSPPVAVDDGGASVSWHGAGD